MFAALVSAVGLIASPLDLGGLSLADARELHGRPVLVTFTVAAPPDSDDLTTYLGAGEAVDVSRSAHVPKDLLLREGDTVTVFGRLEVRFHPPRFCNGFFGAGWHEVRVTGAAVVRRGER